MLDELNDKLATAEKRAIGANAKVNSLRRLIAKESKKRETQRLCTLGRAVEAWTAENDALLSAFKAFLARYLSRPGDFEVLEGTPFEVGAATPATEASNG